MRIALAQIDTTVGDLPGNASLVAKWSQQAADRGAQLVIFPELTICGYPPKDLCELGEFIDRCRSTLEQLAKDPVFSRIHALVGFPERHGGEGTGLYNAVALLHGGRVGPIVRKCLLPTYDVFDEARYFDASEHSDIVEIGGAKIGVTICDDLWNDKQFWRVPRYRFDPVEELAARGAEAIVNLSASPYAVGKPAVRREMVAAAARRHRLPIALCNLIGGDDSLIFDGGSLLVGADGTIKREGALFREELIVEDLSLRAAPRVVEKEPAQPNGAPLAVVASYETELGDASCAEIAEALTIGIRDYSLKTGFK